MLHLVAPIDGNQQGHQVLDQTAVAQRPGVHRPCAWKHRHQFHGDTLRLGDLKAYEGVTFLDDPETVLATVTLPTREEEPEVAEVPEGEEVPEGAEAPAADSEAPAAEGEAPAEG